jgi:Zn finger protein HypA/HybF involved in hydrogenase expression
MKMTLIPVTDTKCVCRNCKKEFTIPKEQMLEDYRQCTFCGSLKWDYKDDDFYQSSIEHFINSKQN